MQSPKLSVIIPTFNEEGTLGQLLDRILASEVDLEVIIVDDGSTDRTSGVLDTHVDHEHITRCSVPIC